MRLLIALPIALLLAAPARAGTYEHHTLTAASPGLDGWSASIHAPGGYVAAGPGAGPILGVQFWGRATFDPGDLARWVYDAPPDTTIAAWDVQRAVSGIGAGDWNTLLRAVESGRWRDVAHDVPSVARGWGAVSAPRLDAAQLDARLQCGGPHRCVPAGVAALALRSSHVVLHDALAPLPSLVQGELVAAPVLGGTAALSFAAADRGGGLYRAWAAVDGRPGEPVAIGDDRCRDLLPGGDPYQFAHRRPCPLSAGATVAIDTTELAEGRHEVSVFVEDAAGNRTTVYGPLAKTVDNLPDPRPPAVRAPAPQPLVVTAWLERRHRRAMVVTAGYGERVRLRGRVTDAAGHPLPGAAVAVAEQVFGRRPWRPVTGVRTLADGRFTTFTRVGPSRRLRVAGAPLALTVNVRARVTAQVRGAVLRGRVVGASRGALVELQARAGRRWITRRVVRSYAGGRYSGRPGARGLVRARVPAQLGLPYAAGVSPPCRAGRTAAGTSR